MKVNQKCSCGGSVLIAKFQQAQAEKLVTYRRIQCSQCGARALSTLPEAKEAA